MTYGELSESQARRSRQFAEAQTNAMSVYCDAERDLKELQAENAKLRELAENLLMAFVYLETPDEQQECIVRALDLRRELDVLPMDAFDARELGIEVDG